MKTVKNYLYNMSYQVFALIVPLLTTPYISRVLGPHGVGINTLTNSTTQYFTLLATLGLGFYGQRQIAYKRDDKVELSKNFWEIEILSIFTTVVSLLLFTVFLIIDGEYIKYYLAQSFLILACAADISWLFMGLENFKVTVLRNFVVKFFSVILIFAFVRTKEDIFNYILIISGTTLLGNLSLWPYLKKTIIFHLNVKLHPFYHLKNTLELFVPQIAISIYSILNKIMLATLGSVELAAYFDNSDKIIRILLTVVSAFTTVMMPHVANAYVKGATDKVNKMLNDGLAFAIIITFPMVSGLISVSSKFIPWFLGNKFYPTINVIRIESLAIMPIAIAGIIGAQYLVAINKNKLYTISIFGGAIVTILINVPLILYLGAIGAAVTSVLSELCVTVTQIWFTRKTILFKQFYILLTKAFIAAIIMGIAISLEVQAFPSNFFAFLIEAITGIIIYGCILWTEKVEEFRLVCREAYRWFSIKRFN
ncbi:flippase [Secundilactobacillus yichangensis]|uniref:flippase n=1 Tax=Secundilactobacillus yichangensis TaxID=2799580 RepID=UPI0019412006|nr:flippase [Secundilactobacillus yichangensis]